MPLDVSEFSWTMVIHAVTINMNRNKGFSQLLMCCASVDQYEVQEKGFCLQGVKL